VVELDEVVADGLAGESPQPRATAALAAPMTAIASRRPIFLLFISAPRNLRSSSLSIPHDKCRESVAAT
jgi:hypothetical protein